MFFFGISIVIGFTFLYYNTHDKALQYDVQKTTKKLKNVEEDFNRFKNDKVLLNKLTNHQFGYENIEKLKDFPFEIFIFKDGSLTLWTSNNIQISYLLDDITEVPKVHELRNGYYLVQKFLHNDCEILICHLIKNNFAIENKFLRNDFNNIYPLSSSLEVLPPEKGKYVFSFNTNPIFSTTPNIDFINEVNFVNIGVGYAFLFVIHLFVFFALFFVFKELQWYKVLSLMILFFILLKILLPSFPIELFKTTLFSPELYASVFFGDSLGGFFTNVFWISMFIIFLYRTINFQSIFTKKINVLLFALFQTSFFLYLTFSIKSVVLDSVVSYEITTFAELNTYTLIGLALSVYLSISFFYLQSVFLRYISVLGKIYHVLFLLQLILIFCTLWFNLFYHLSFLLVFILVAFNYFYLYYVHNKSANSFFTNYLTIVGGACLLIALNINYFNLEKETTRKSKVAFQLNSQKDLIAEYTFKDRLEEIQSDPFIKKYFTLPLVSNRDLIQRINYLYLGGYLSKYNNEVLTFSADGSILKSMEIDSIDNYLRLINNNTDGTLQFINLNNGSFMFLSVVEIFEENKLVGYLVFSFTPQKFLKDNLYPELLVEDKNRPIIEIELEIYDYAIYNDNKLTAQSGEYFFPFNYDFTDGYLDKPTLVKKNDYSHMIFFENEHKIIVVSSPIQSILIPFSIFSYVFFFIVIISLVVFLAITIFNVIFSGKPLVLIKPSFRYTINFSILFIIFISFIIVGIITVRYFSFEYENYHRQNLNQKQRQILLGIENLTQDEFTQKEKYDFFQNTIYTDLKSMAEINAIDINVFDLQGTLITSSQPGIFSNGLISKKMSPEAFTDLNYNGYDRLIKDEKIGKLKFLSSYIPIRDKSDNVIAYLNLPYFNKEKNFRKEISDYIVAFINVYILLLVLASVLGLIVSNSITRSLAQISEKLSTVNISRKNEFLTWNADDEIGALVKEYNNMILELEKGADALAKSERESAWREMARQIAHEIKNPLTPMKLSIQHLQRAMNDDPERAKDMTQKVCKNLIEQIDNLSHIATAFSSFAEMPKGEKEPIELLPIIQNIAQLFSTESGFIIEVKSVIENPVIFANKNQMVSVFNNLIKNSVQAVENEEKPSVSVELFVDDTYYIVKVKDNGVGISSDLAEKVFVPNFTTKSSGTGLGLAISKQIIENISGEIWFKSSNSKGTTFFVKLQIHQ